MSIQTRMTRCPIPFDPDRAADARALVPDLAPELGELIGGVAGCSPYLAGLIEGEADWLPGALDAPEAERDAVLSGIAALAPDALSVGLRHAKRRIALLAALADLSGAWPLETVTEALTLLADAAIQRVLEVQTEAEIARGKLPGQGPEDIPVAGGLVALAMGKMGAFELNYSSDIDLICLFDETRFDRDDYPDARASFIRTTRKLAAMLSDQTEAGYVFRTDLRLRPDAAVTPVAMAMSGAESYYESVGRTWERAAYIKARPAAGDIAAGEGFLKTLVPFVWRKHLDFAAIQDAHDMRLKIRDHKGLHGPLNLMGHNVKLGRGGIREIEFFTQTRQLIAGGRDPSLRVSGTVEGLARLAAAGWIDTASADTLTAHYRAHRELEHRLQMVNDAQTQEMPTSEEGFARIAAFMGQTPEDLRRDLSARFEEVHELTEGFFAPGKAEAVPDDFGAETVRRWRSYPALRSERAVAIFKRLRPDLMRRLQEAAVPEEALASFDGFLAGLPAGVQVFSLFEANPQLTQLIVDIAATAPALALYLSQNSAVLDAVIGGSFFAPWPGVEALVEKLSEALAAPSDYEKRLDMARRWMKEWHFRIGVHHLRGLADGVEAGRMYADLAEAVVVAIWPYVVAEFAAKHGPMPGRGAAVLAMGSLGAGRLNAGSDLDLIMIYDDAGVENSDGPRPLATRPYYARLTQALLTALTAPTAEGRLYEVDMRLRPSGRQGPVATSIASFESYQMTEAWTWEHLALTRARPIAGDGGVCDTLDKLRTKIIAAKSQGETVRTDVADMRVRLDAAKPSAGDWDAKFGLGRLMDIELTAQTLALLSASDARDILDQIAAGEAAGLVTGQAAQALREAAGLFWRLQAASRLLTGGLLDPEALGEGGRRMVLRETGAASMDALRDSMQSCAEAAAQVIAQVLDPKAEKAPT